VSELETVLLDGDFSHERVNLEAACARFGWETRPNLGRDSRNASVVAALVDLAQDEPAVARLARLREELPGVPLIACVRFSQWRDWTELADAGAYYMLHRPFDEAEVRQALGFLHAMTGRSAGVRPSTPRKEAERERRVAQPA
jgi:DNA-binding NtrC family response regulator